MIGGKLTALGENTNEYKLEGERVWVDIDSISVCIVKTDDGVVVDLFANDHENDVGCLATAGITFQDALDAIEEFEE
jgi:hypothetical protein